MPFETFFMCFRTVFELFKPDRYIKSWHHCCGSVPFWNIACTRSIKSCNDLKHIYQDYDCCNGNSNIGKTTKCRCQLPEPFPENSETLTITLSDQQRDGWDNAFLSIKGGYCSETILTMYPLDGARITETIPIPPNTCITITYVKYFYHEEHTFQIITSNGEDMTISGRDESFDTKIGPCT